MLDGVMFGNLFPDAKGRDSGVAGSPFTFGLKTNSQKLSLWVCAARFSSSASLPPECFRRQRGCFN